MALAVALALGVIPGISGLRPLAQGIDVLDASVGLLILLGCYRNWRQGTAALTTRYQKQLLALSGLLITWWLVTFARSVLGSAEVPPAEAARTGRDFLYIAVLPVLMTGVLSDPVVRSRFVVLLAAIAGYASITQIPWSLGWVELPFLVHNDHVLQEGSITRLYPLTNELLATAVMFGVGGALLRYKRWIRLAILSVVALSVLAVALLLGRATYLGLAVALTVVAALYFRRVGLKLVAAIAVLAAVSFAVVSLSPESRPSIAITAVSDRLSSAFTDLRQPAGAGDNTVTYRLSVAKALTNRLDREDAWLTGLGFLSVTSNYDSTIPSGSIRSPDFGYLNAVTTMGLIGMVLVFAPVLLSALWLFRAAQTIDPRSWLLFGGFAFCVFAVVVSNTLAVLFSPVGALITGLALGLALGALNERELERCAPKKASPSGQLP